MNIKIIPALLGAFTFMIVSEVLAAGGIKGKWLLPEPGSKKVPTLIQLVKAPEKFSQAERKLVDREGWLVYRLVWREDCRSGLEIKHSLEKLSRQLSIKSDRNKIYLDFSQVPQALYAILDIPDFWAGLWGEAWEKPFPETLFAQVDGGEGYLAALLGAAKGYERLLNLRHLPWYIKEKNKRVPQKLQSILGKLKELKRKPTQYPIHWNQLFTRKKVLKMLGSLSRVKFPPSITYVSPNPGLSPIYWLRVISPSESHKPIALFAQMGKNRLDLETINIKEIKLDLTDQLAKNSDSDPYSGLSIYHYNRLIHAGPWRSLTLSLEVEEPLDREPPQISEISPENGAKGVNRTPTVTFKVTDSESGVNPDSIEIKLNDVWLTPQVSGNAKEYQVMARYKEKLGFRQKVELQISVGDLADPPNVTEKNLTFTTEREELFEIRVNCGGEGYVDKEGKVWERDRPYTEEEGWGYFWKGMVINQKNINPQIYDTGNPRLYQSHRYEFGDYRFKLPNERYLVIMHYAEIGRKESRFNVKVEGDTVYTNFNPYRYAGRFTALQLHHVVDLTDGELKVWAEYRKGRRFISGIEIYAIPEDKTEDTTSPEFRNWFPSAGKTASAFTSVPMSDFGNLSSELYNKGIIKYSEYDPEWVYFDQAFISQSELSKKLMEIGIAETEKILKIWRESLTPVTVRILDADSGVDQGSLWMWVNGKPVKLSQENFEGNTRALTITYYPPEPFPDGEAVSVIISVQDQAVIPNRATGELQFYIQND